ncbi:MAG: ABC transporter substrate-binding protein [Candidatus Bipolaricaulia bacterium]
MFQKRQINLVTTLIVGFVLVTATAFSPLAGGMNQIKVSLDWTPNTNHTGLYVAKKRGYFADENLKVKIVQPAKATTSIQLTASGKTEFGINTQEYVTMARSRGVPVVSIAAIIQHNTSGFAAPEGRGIDSVEDFEGHRYGGWGTKLENQLIKSVMKKAGADFSSVKFVNLGMTDFVTAARQKMADFFWIFRGWEGIHADIEGLDYNYIPLTELSETFDYYTPIFITGETLIKDNPQLVEDFLRAVSRGYRYAEKHPEKAAEILLKGASELDRELVVKSQKYLSDKYSAGVERWGVQKKEPWQDFTDWMYDHELIENKIEASEAFTNEFLPEQEN